MTILFGHPTGNPNSHHAALAHLLAGRLEAFCVPWMPSACSFQLFKKIAPFMPTAKRLMRRRFPQLADAPLVQDPCGELKRLLLRALGLGGEGLSYEANDWLMRTMTRECHRATVTAVHAYEDCSFSQFAAAKRLNKACIYDLPIGYYPAWERMEGELCRRFPDWLGGSQSGTNRYVRIEQKRQEMELADLVLVPGTFVANTVREFHPNKNLVIAPYGVDTEFWCPAPNRPSAGPLRFLYAGQLSLRKGIPILLEAWQKAALPDAELELVGSWYLAQSKRQSLPRGVIHYASLGPEALRDRYRQAQVFVFPSYFEGFGLVLAEAMACGLPAIASEASAGPDLITEADGRLMPVGNVDSLVENLRWFNDSRHCLPNMSKAARLSAEQWTWDSYRCRVTEAVTPFA